VSRSPLTTATPLSPALELIFARWTPHLLWLLGRHEVLRFGEIEQRLTVGTAILSRRLRELESAGLITRRHYPEHPVRVEYSLTGLGRTVLPLLNQVVEWSDSHLPQRTEES
jgi:DNA-binding HxlR family transcriptional regulator